MFDDEDAKSNNDLRVPYRPVKRFDNPVQPPEMDESTRERWKMLCFIALFLGVVIVVAWLRS